MNAWVVFWWCLLIFFICVCYGLPILPCIIILNATGKHGLGIFGDAFSHILLQIQRATVKWIGQKMSFMLFHYARTFRWEESLTWSVIRKYHPLLKGVNVARSWDHFHFVVNTTVSTLCCFGFVCVCIRIHLSAALRLCFDRNIGKLSLQMEVLFFISAWFCLLSSNQTLHIFSLPLPQLPLKATHTCVCAHGRAPG